MELSEIRGEIDKIDKELLALFLERMSLSAEAAKFKAENGMKTLDEDREKHILEKICEESGDMGQYSRRLYEKIFELSREYQQCLI